MVWLQLASMVALFAVVFAVCGELIREYVERRVMGEREKWRKGVRGIEASANQALRLVNLRADIYGDEMVIKPIESKGKK